MEFDTNTAARGPSEIDDEKRLSAATKRVTLTPLHTDIRPELKPDGSSEGEYGLDAPVANIPSDMENTGSDTREVRSSLDADDTPPTAAHTAQSPIIGPSTTPSTTTASFLPTTPPTPSRSHKLPLIIGASVAGVAALGIAAFLLFRSI